MSVVLCCEVCVVEQQHPGLTHLLGAVGGPGPLPLPLLRAIPIPPDDLVADLDGPAQVLLHPRVRSHPPVVHLLLLLLCRLLFLLLIVLLLVVVFLFVFILVSVAVSPILRRPDLAPPPDTTKPP